MAATYGLGAAGLTGLGLDQKNDAMRTLGNVADQEQQRGIANKQAEQDRKAGNQQLGSTVGALGGMMIGASYGSVGGPIGAMIGGVVGGLAAGLL